MNRDSATLFNLMEISSTLTSSGATVTQGYLKTFSRARDRLKNFGFVTFCRRSSAVSAIESVDRAGPLFLKVRFKMEEEEKVER